MEDDGLQVGTSGTPVVLVTTAVTELIAAPPKGTQLAVTFVSIQNESASVATRVQLYDGDTAGPIVVFAGLNGGGAVMNFSPPFLCSPGNALKAKALTTAASVLICALAQYRKG